MRKQVPMFEQENEKKRNHGGHERLLTCTTAGSR
jgi:hypothetical protein